MAAPKNDIILCFDTETTGVPNRPQKFDTYYSPEQTHNYDSARIVQIAWQLFAADGTAAAPPVMYYLRPDGWTITAANQQIHGITQELCLSDGKSFSEVGVKFLADLQLSTMVIGHNTKFDVHIVASEFYRSGQPRAANEVMSKNRGCTMALGGQLAPFKRRSPKLIDLYKHLFGRNFEDAHTAMADMQATAMIWFKLKGTRIAAASAVVAAAPAVVAAAPAVAEPAPAVAEPARTATDVSSIVNIKISKLFVSERNVRKDLNEFDETSVADLAANIQSHGLLHPLTVREMPDKRFEIIAGQRRFLALNSLGREDAPCRVVTLGDLEAEEISLTENTQRAQLSSGDKARTYSRLYEITGRDIAKLSKAVSVTPVTLRKYIKIAELPEQIMAQLDVKGDGRITIETAVALTKIPPAHQVDAAAAVSKLATSSERLEATKRIAAEAVVGKNIDAGRMDHIVESINTERLEAKKLLAPTVPWIPDRDGMPMVIPKALYGAILDMIESAE
jgi:DNA polymerase-3 subunit epsilon